MGRSMRRQSVMTSVTGSPTVEHGIRHGAGWPSSGRASHSPTIGITLIDQPLGKFNEVITGGLDPLGDGRYLRPRPRP